MSSTRTPRILSLSTVASQGQPSTHQVRATLLIVLLTIGLVSLAIGLRARSGAWLAAYWLEQLETAPETEIDTVLDRLAQLGSAGIPSLVQAMDSPRELVAHGAKRRLWDEIGEWEGVYGRDAARRVACLARALADRVDRLGPNAQQHAADLAARLLAWPLTDDVSSVRRVIAACEKVIRTAGGPRPTWTANLPKGPRDSSTNDNPILEASRRSETDDTAQGQSIKQLMHLSGGDIPITSVDQVAPQSSIAAGKSSQERSGSGTQSSTQAVAKPGTTPSPPSPDSQGPPDKREPGRLDAADGRPLTGGVAASRSGSPGQPARQPESGVALVTKELLKTDTLELMRRLRAANDAEAANAQLELRRRGFTEVHLEMAKQLFDPDPEVRRQLARMLPELHSVNSAPWLMWLCRDTDPEVRLLAVTLLATSNDPTILAQVERIARTDSDSRVQAQATRIAGLRTTGPDGASKTTQY